MTTDAVRHLSRQWEETAGGKAAGGYHGLCVGGLETWMGKVANDSKGRKWQRDAKRWRHGRCGVLPVGGGAADLQNSLDS